MPPNASEPQPILRYIGYYFADQTQEGFPSAMDIASQCQQRPVLYVIFGYLLAYPDNSLAFEPAYNFPARFNSIFEDFLDYCMAAASQWGSPVAAAYHRQGGMGNLAYSNPRWELYEDHTYFDASPAG